MMQRFLDLLRRFRSDERGSQTVEFVLVLPLLLWAVGALFVFVEAFALRSVSTKASYTVADLLSRQTDPVDQDLLDGTAAVLNFLTGSQTDGRLRVTVLRCTANCDAADRTLAIDWSHAAGDMTPLTSADLTTAEYIARIPDTRLGDRLLMVETEVDFHPPLGFGLSDRTFETMMITRPRFAPHLCWESCVGV
jgi:hypothetical protein